MKYNKQMNEIMKIKQLLSVLSVLLILLCVIVILLKEGYIVEENSIKEEMVEKNNIKEEKAEEIINSFPIVESLVEKEEVNRISWENSRDEHLYVVEQEPEKLKKLIKNIAEHPELSAAEKEFTISTIRYSGNCPLECLDGYSKYKREFEEKNPSGIDPETNYTFEELINYHASYAERVREELEKNKEKEFFMN